MPLLVQLDGPFALAQNRSERLNVPLQVAVERARHDQAVGHDHRVGSCQLAKALCIPSIKACREVERADTGAVA